MLEFTEANRAITLAPSEAADFFHIVMPMQIE
jgi:DNA polymerase III sliding clamp (beta) subunit (PCNA family)